MGIEFDFQLVVSLHGELIVTSEETAQIPAENGSYGILLIPIMTVFRRGEFVAQTFQGHALKNHAARAGERGQEQTFAAENSGANASHQLDVIVYGWLEGNKMAGLHLQHFTGSEGEVYVVSASVHENQARASQLLQNKSLAAQQASS